MCQRGSGALVIIYQESNTFLLSTKSFIAELQRTKRASEASWVRIIGNPSSRENLVMTSPPPESVRTRREGKGRIEIFLTVTHTLAVFCLEKSEKHSFLFAMSTNDRRG